MKSTVNMYNVNQSTIFMGLFHMELSFNSNQFSSTKVRAVNSEVREQTFTYLKVAPLTTPPLKCRIQDKRTGHHANGGKLVRIAH